MERFMARQLPYLLVLGGLLGSLLLPLPAEPIAAGQRLASTVMPADASVGIMGQSDVARLKAERLAERRQPGDR